MATLAFSAARRVRGPAAALLPAPRPPRRGRGPGLLLAVVAAAGLALLAAGLWIPAKAWLAGRLLERSWRNARAGATATRPWPWADTFAVARLRVPRLGVDAIVLAGASGRTLAFAPGHVDGTAPPAGDGNCALAGHRDTTFRFLRELRPGDTIEIEAASGLRRRYAVRETAVVDQADTGVLAPTDAPALTLVTCWPFDALRPGGRGRYVVRAVDG